MNCDTNFVLLLSLQGMSLEADTSPLWPQLRASRSSLSAPMSSSSSPHFLIHPLSFFHPSSSSLSSSPFPVVLNFRDCAVRNASCVSHWSSSSSSSAFNPFLREPYRSDSVLTSRVVTSEVTMLPDDMTFGHVNLMSVVVLSILCLVASIGNTTVFWTLWKQRRCGSRVNLFIMNLCVADLIVALVMMPLEIAWHTTVQWMAGDLLCRIMMFFRAFGPYLSSNILVAISLDRYLTIRRPLSMNSANRRSRVMILLAWTFSIVYCLPQSIIFHLESHPTHKWFSQCVTFNFFSNSKVELVYNVFSLLAIYLFPLVVIVASYTLILCLISAEAGKARLEAERNGDSGPNNVHPGTRFKFSQPRRQLERQQRKTSKSSGTAFTLSPGVDQSSRSSRLVTSGTFDMTSSARIIQQARSRTLKMTVVIVSVFIVCWTPYFVMSTWYWFHYTSASQVHPTLQKVLFLFAMSNSCVDPIVYGMFSTAFRRSTVNWCTRFKQIFLHTPSTHRQNQSFK